MVIQSFFWDIYPTKDNYKKGFNGESDYLMLNFHELPQDSKFSNWEIG